MDRALSIISESGTAIANLDHAVDQARTFVAASKAANTLRGYESDWRCFERWCTAQGLKALPAAPQTVGLYLAALADRLKPATLDRRLRAISYAHHVRGLELVTGHTAIRDVFAGIRRVNGTAQIGKAAVLATDLRVMVTGQPDTPLGIRDRALLLIGFCGAFRRSELVALDLADIEWGPDGLAITIRRSKTDQEGQGRKVGIPYGGKSETCPVRALVAWIECASIEDGPLFRSVNGAKIGGGRLSDKAVARAVKRAAMRVGLDPTQYAGHSLRAGLATSAAAVGASERAIMDQGGWKSVTMARRYIRDGSLFRDNPAAMVGL
jgi:integrase